MAVSPTIEKLQKKLEKEPNPLIFLQLAEEYRKESHYDDALRVCRDGLKRHPNYWSMRVAVGRIYSEMGDLDKAREELEKVIKAVPDNLLANKILGDIYLQQDRPADALKRYKIVQMITPADQEVIANIQKIEGFSGTPAPKPKAPEPPPVAAPPRPAEPPAFLEKTEPGIKVPFGEETMPRPLDPEPEPKVEALPSFETIEQLMEEAPESPSTYNVAFDPMVSEPAELKPQMPPEIPPQLEDFSATDMDSMDLEEVIEEQRNEVRAEDRTQPMSEPVQMPAPAPEPAVEDAEELTTQTLAELYVQQGLIDKAIRVYQKLLLNDPTNSKIIQRLKELSTAEPLLSSPAVREEKARISMQKSKETPASANRNLDHMSEERKRKISTLENWLSTIRRERS